MTGITRGEVVMNLGDGDNTVTFGTAFATNGDAEVSVTLGSGDDEVTVDGDSGDKGTLTLTFGTGDDTLNITGAGDLSDMTLNLTGLEIIQLASDGTTATDGILPSSDLDGQSFQILGEGLVSGAQQDELGVELSSSTTSFDGSSLQISDSLSTGVLGLVISGGKSTGVTVTGSGGVDTITTTTAADTVTGGLGGDTIDLGSGASVLDTLIVAAGDTEVTTSMGATSGGTGANASISGFDAVSNFIISDGSVKSDIFDTAGDPSVLADGTYDIGGTSGVTAFYNAAADGDSSVVFQKFVVSQGIATFHDNDTVNGTNTAIDLTNAGTEDVWAGAIASLQSLDLGDAGVTVAFLANAMGSTNTDTVVFTQSTAGGTDASDVVVVFDDQEADALVTSNVANANDLFLS